MATYIGIIAPYLSMPVVGILTNLRPSKYHIGIITNSGEGMTLISNMTDLRATKYRMGINLYNYNYEPFRRIPKEHILNKLSRDNMTY
ncbi:hypothetical protein GTH52_06950 [Clostridium tyrobutyricum]|uniref:Uncharacterized protein n=1 Tax=Clostridium tyrobutyricum DIVETGP TaxID=1408889 RepID=W6N5S6_CLOTY|nr:hypothetical protein [Clostridium tyrobutyricum]AND84295.1 hypothetical protein CTK_C10340 [Clostridium tyrobutyricum]AND84379.1 hypothetical protein CTK_C11180 [Clostridium tyrobutyricum]ANP69006.1 hypothetical protein BA182_04755 [Clostridium tyrobutyricum]MBR9648759.1 hypothetical protein [Clostridium tyrobutyricum]MBV4435388.1 hypothetical protein [Clostridium tyrobutyricum]